MGGADRRKKAAEAKAKRQAAAVAKKTGDVKSEDAKAASAEAAGADDGAAAAQPVKPELNFSERGFFEKTGPKASRRQNMNMDFRVEGIMLYAGDTVKLTTKGHSGQLLLDSAVLVCNYGQKYGMVGRNGVGKSSLLRAISNGLISVPSFIHTVHVEQECAGDDRTALETVLDADMERKWLLKMEEELCAETIDEESVGIDLNEVYERLDEMEADKRGLFILYVVAGFQAETRAACILSGLGFEQDMMSMPTKSFSGGWRMRISLAQALFVSPDLLLLDEPTNHLDVFACTWLEQFLNAWEKTVIIVSHDRGFLNRVTRNTIFLHRQRLWYYGGSYDTFLKVRAEKRKHSASMAKSNAKRAADLKQFIMRFGQGHRKMAKQAQSRMKLLERIQGDHVELDFDDPYLKLDFPAAQPLPPPCISVMNVSFGYEEGKLLYEGLNFGIDCESRVAIVGPNGAGKSTMLSLLETEILPVEGAISRHSKLRTAKFTQHHIEMFDMESSSVDHMRRLDEDRPIEEARKYLGRFGLTGELALRPIKNLSGGQKSRLAFAELAFHQPHILFLDEPTNHLDLETIEALAMAINRFEGGVVIVSHDERLISMVADELWHVERRKGDKPGSVTIFDGSFDEYRQMLETQFEEQGLMTGALMAKRQ